MILGSTSLTSNLNSNEVRNLPALIGIKKKLGKISDPKAEITLMTNFLIR